MSAPSKFKSNYMIRKEDRDYVLKYGPVIFLDLDNTLVSAVDTTNMSSSSKLALVNRYKRRFKHIAPYDVFPRMHLDRFLSELFMSYRVGVFTAGSKEYAEAIVKEFILKPDPSRVLETFLYRRHVNDLINYGWGFKDLYALTKEFNYKNMEDVYIVDDNVEVYRTQPDKCIHVHPFEATDIDQGGNALMKALDLIYNTVYLGNPLINYEHTNL